MKNLNRVHLNGLRALEAVGRLGSLQAAAGELGVTLAELALESFFPANAATAEILRAVS